MFSVLLFFHSIFRWLVLTSLCCSIFVAARKYLKKAPFTKSDNSLRHWTATIAHIQLMIGMVMYFKSTTVAQFRAFGHDPARGIDEPFFFGLIHISLMIMAIIIITIGSAVSRRQEEDHKKFRLMLIFFVAALVIILAAIPWPFSPLSQRPYFRNL
jgi:cytochrome c biogenesis factor